MRAHIKAAEPFDARGRVRRAGARALPRRAPGLQGRADRRSRQRRRAEPAPRAAEDRLAVHQRPLHRPLPRPACAQHQDRRRLQAQLARRRLLARGLHADDAHAHLRHRVLRQGRARAAPRAHRAGQGARPPQARARARPVHLLRGLARRRLLAAGRARACSTRSSRCRARWAPSAATARSRRRRSSTPSCGRPPGTGASTARTCSRCRSRSARWRSSR